MYRFAVARTGDTHQAEDLVQETLLAAIRAHSDFDGRSSIRTWLVGILRRKIADHFRKTGRSLNITERPNPGNDLSGLLAPQLATSDFRSAAERTEFREALRNCLALMPENLAEPLIRRLAGDSLDDIAVAQEITKNNLTVRLFRARLSLRKCLETAWMGISPTDESRK